MRTLLIAGLLLFLGSCTHQYTNLPSVVVNNDFKTLHAPFRNSLGTPESVIFYIKTFEQDGMLAFCGVSVLTGRGVADQLTDQWLNGGFITIDGKANKIVSTRFIGQVSASEPNKMANCVKSTVPATPTLLHGIIWFTGSQANL